MLSYFVTYLVFGRVLKQTVRPLENANVNNIRFYYGIMKEQ